MEGGEVKSVIRNSGFTFKKKYGQNFITDQSLLDEMVERAGVNKDSTVIEIGCGAGTLTRAIAKRAGFVYGYEIDKSLEAVLSRTLAGIENAQIIFKDFMRVRLDEMERETPDYEVVANLPYYITTPLIMTFVENSKKCRSLTVMVQKEVAERLCARSGTADYGAITAAVALRGEPKILMQVGREKFTPSPAVDSAVVKISLTDNRLDVEDKEAYKKAVRCAFAQRRKTLENNLMVGYGIDRQTAKQIISACGFGEGVRGETLSPEDFAVLSREIVKRV